MSDPLIPNYNSLADTIDRLIVEVSKLSWYENTKRQESIKDKPNYELVWRMDKNSRDCCELRDALKREIDHIITEIVETKEYTTLDTARTFAAPKTSVSDLLEDMSYSAPERIRKQLAEQFKKELGK